MTKKRLSLCIPNEYAKNIYEVDFGHLYLSGKRLVLIDLDNTIADYDTFKASKEIKLLFEKIKSLGFDVMIISNNAKKRVSGFADELSVSFKERLYKPMTGKIRKVLSHLPYKKEEIIWIGDQILTDVLCASKIGIASVLVDPIKKTTEKWYTKMRRIREEKTLSEIKEYYLDRYIELGLNKR